MTEKAALRESYRLKRLSLSEHEVEQRSRRIQNTVITDPAFHEASSVAVYSPIHHEVMTRTIITRGWETKKILLLPHWQPDKKAIRFYQIDSQSDLQGTPWGTQEPVPSHATAWDTRNIDLMLIPGLVFDHQGFRLGYGHGGYDRILACYSGKTWGLAYEMQVIDSLPHEPHDIPCSRIITEQRQIEVS